MAKIMRHACRGKQAEIQLCKGPALLTQKCICKGFDGSGI